MSEYTLVRIESEERSRFVTAWEQAFSRRLDQSVYDWIFNEKNIIYGLVYDGEICAGYCLYPLKCYLKGRESVALLCNNVFVCPEHQGKHLFVKIGKSALKDASEKKYGALAYGIPNALALPGHKRVGWGVQKPIMFLEKTRGNSSGTAKNEWSFGRLTEEQRTGIANCSRHNGAGRNFSIIKNEEFISWRYESKPGVRYWFGLARKDGNVVAYCICKYYPERQILHFIDVDGECEDRIAELVREAELISEPFENLNIWGATAKKNVFERCGYTCSDDFDNFIVMDLEGLKPAYLQDNFNLCLGDNDVY